MDTQVAAAQPTAHSHPAASQIGVAVVDAVVADALYGSAESNGHSNWNPASSPTSPTVATVTDTLPRLHLNDDGVQMSLRTSHDDGSGSSLSGSSSTNSERGGSLNSGSDGREWKRKPTSPIADPTTAQPSIPSTSQPSSTLAANGTPTAPVQIRQPRNLRDDAKDGDVQPGSDLSDFFRAESLLEEMNRRNQATFSAEALAEWRRFTRLFPIDPQPDPGADPYDDLIAHSLDDFSAAKEAELESRCEPNGDPARTDPIRLAFCRVIRHNARTKRPNLRPESFHFLKILGEGSFGTVYMVRDKETHKDYAVKVMSKRQIAKERKMQYIVREKDIMAILTHSHGGHPFVAKIFCSFQEGDRLYIAMSYARHGELLTLLKRVGAFDIDVARFYSSELVTALEYIHACGVVHRDVKPENILIKADGHIMLTDFGSAKVLGFEGDERPYNPTEQQSTVPRGTFVGTPHYMSPEVAKSRPSTPAADFWALGAVLYQMISGQPPFRAANEYQILRKVANLQYTMPDSFDEAAKDLVRKLLVVNVEERLGYEGIDAIKQHEFFKSVDWPNILSRSPPPLMPGSNPNHPDELSRPTTPKDLGLTAAAMTRMMRAGKASSSVVDDSDDDAVLEKLRPPLPNKRPNGAQPPKKHPFEEFADGNVVIRSGVMNKKRGLFARQRMFLLTDVGRIYYIDPTKNELKGQIVLTTDTWLEARNFHAFNIHTPYRVYRLYDPEHNAAMWCETIEKIRQKVCNTETDEVAERLAFEKLGKRRSYKRKVERRAKEKAAREREAANGTATGSMKSGTTKSGN